MKKSIIAMAVAGALAVPAIASADATLYGSVRMALSKDSKPSTSAKLADNFTRIGIRGTVDLGLNDTVGIYNWETGLNTNSDGEGVGSLRYASMGATGSWGTAVAGRIDHFTWNYAGGVTDLFVSGNGDILSIDYVGSGSGRADRRQNNTLAYVSPDMGGLTLGVGAVMAGDTGFDKDREVDGYNLGAKYSIEGLTVGLGYGAVKTSKSGNVYAVDENIISVGASYAIDALTLAAAYERATDKTGLTDVKDKGYSLAANYEVDGLGAVIAFSEAQLANNDKGKRVQAEVYNRIGRGMVAAGYTDNNAKVRGGTNNTYYVSYRLDF